MIALKIVIDEKARAFVDIGPAAEHAPSPAEEVAASIMHHALKAGHDEIAAQIAAGELRCDAEVITRLTRRPK
jgi:hypothetical protein